MLLVGRRYHQLVAAITLGLLYILGHILQITYENCFIRNDLEILPKEVILQAGHSISKHDSEDHNDQDTTSLFYSGEICSNLKESSIYSRPGIRWNSLMSELDKYKHFHNHQLSTYASKERSTHRDIRTLTWYCDDFSLCSGLADQLYRIQFAFILALISNRVFMISWNTTDDGYRTFQYLHPNQIDWSVRLVETHHHQEKLHLTDLVSVMDSSVPHIAVSDSIPVPFYRSFARTKHFPKINAGYENLGLLHLLGLKEYQHNLVYVMGVLLRYLFKISPEVIQEVDRLQASMGLTSHHYLALHIRTGFTGNSRFEENGKYSRSKLVKDPNTWRAMLSCGLKLSSKRISPKSAIYLATDSNLVKKLAQDNNDKRIQTANITAFHSAHCKEECGKELWTDFILIARAQYVVRGGSGFAKIASAFCLIPQQNQCNQNCNCKAGY